MLCCLQRGSPGHQTPLPGSSHSAVNNAKKEERVSSSMHQALSLAIKPNADHQLGADAPDGICSFTQGCCWLPSTPSNKSLKASACLFAPGMLSFTPHPPDPKGRGEMPCLQPFREDGPQQVLGKHAAHQPHLSCTAAADAQPLL